MKNSERRAKGYTFIVYAENNDIDKIRNYIECMHYSAAVSPMHHGDDETIKPHYHIVVMFANPRKCNAVTSEFQTVANVTVAIPVGDIKSITRYLTHMDSPEKEQFDCVPEIYGAFQYNKYIYRAPDASEDAAYMVNVIAALNSMPIPLFSRLVLSFSESPDIVTFILRNSYAINVIINEMRATKRGGCK